LSTEVCDCVRMTSLRMIGCALMGILACVLPSIGLATSNASRVPATPIRHLIVIVGENRTFDHVFGGYRPSRGQTVLNLLSEEAINADGTPGPNFVKTQQWQASISDKYSIAPRRTKPFRSLPQPNTTYALGRPPGAPDSRFPQPLPTDYLSPKTVEDINVAGHRLIVEVALNQSSRVKAWPRSSGR
jgi:hypothetical protein